MLNKMHVVRHSNSLRYTAVTNLFWPKYQNVIIAISKKILTRQQKNTTLFLRGLHTKHMNDRCNHSILTALYGTVNGLSSSKIVISLSYSPTMYSFIAYSVSTNYYIIETKKIKNTKPNVRMQ